MAQYSPNPSPMVPEPTTLPPESTSVRPPPIPHQHSGGSSGPSPPAWAAQYKNMNAFPQGYPPNTPYHPAQQAFTPFQQPGSYHPPPVGLPAGIPPTPDARVLPNGLSADWIGSSAGWNPNLPPVTPYNGPQPHTNFSSFQQPLPGGGPPPGFIPNGWGGGPPPAAFSGPWNASMTPAGPGAGWGGGGGGGGGGWGGWGGPQMTPTTPWTGGGGGGGGGGPPPWAQPPAPLAPQQTGGGLAAAMRDRSNEGLDTVDPFATGPHYGPVLTPLLLRVVGAQLKVNPLLTAPNQDLDQVYLKWNMLFNASHCVRSDDKPDKSWSNGRGSPATHPRLTEVEIISPTFPWSITVYAQDTSIGVTCGEIIDRLDDFLHKNLKKEDAERDSANHRVERDHAYYHNRSTAIGVPGGRLGDGLRRLDWLCKDTMFGGLDVDNGFVREYYAGATPPAILTLLCTTRYPLTEQELREQKAREREDDVRVRAAEERARAAEARAAELEEKELRRMRRARSHSRAGSVHSKHSGRSSARSHISRTPSTDEGTDDDDQ